MFKKLFFVFLGTIAVNVYSAQFNITPSSSTKVGFSIVKFKILAPVEGKFDKFQGTYDFDAKTKSLSNVNITIKADSINTMEEKRDNHLKADPDFFDVAKFKTLSFKTGASKVALKEGKSVPVKGKLQIKDVTKEITLNVTYKGMKGDKPQFSANTAIDRTDFKVSWNKPIDKNEDKSLWEKAKSKFKAFAGTVIDNKVTVNIAI